jgi:putative GTP pyrophosphokinase
MHLYYQKIHSQYSEAKAMTEVTPLPKGFKEKLEEEYETLRSSYEKLVDEVMYVLRQSIRSSDIKMHSLASRKTKIKTFESFYGKVISKRNVQRPFEKVEDIAGVRATCLYRSDLEKLGKLIFDKFDVVRADTSRTRTEMPFGYSSDHYIVKLSRKCKGPRYDDIKNLKCEIQVRTLLMYAWASVSHHLQYKQEIDIPRELRADFNALAGLFYVADTHFEMFKKGVTEARETLMKMVQRGEFNLDQEINFDSLAAYMQWKFPERKIRAQSLTDFGWSILITELAKFGYGQIRKLDDKVNVAFPILKELEQREFEQKKWRPVWAPDGLIRAVLDLTDDAHFKRFARHIAEEKTKAHMREKTKKSDFFRRMIALFIEYRSKLARVKARET